MKTLLIAFLSLSSTLLISQKSITWIGGTPGNETNWNEAKNWSSYSVPNEFSDVIIMNSSSSNYSSPVIEKGNIELNSIVVEKNANIVIKKDAVLVIFSHSYGLFESNLENEGSIVLDYCNDDKSNVAEILLAIE